jgi:hypothetical protein
MCEKGLERAQEDLREEVIERGQEISVKIQKGRLQIVQKGALA